jgi:hypothetical protein
MLFTIWMVTVVAYLPGCDTCYERHVAGDNHIHVEFCPKCKCTHISFILAFSVWVWKGTSGVYVSRRSCRLCCVIPPNCRKRMARADDKTVEGSQLNCWATKDFTRSAPAIMHVITLATHLQKNPKAPPPPSSVSKSISDSSIGISGESSPSTISSIWTLNEGVS